MIVGTAGHVDHGKTSLVKALTGVDTDRLPEEKRRGITLELGFASLALPSGRAVSVIDVPGHERFVKAMAAGAGGIDVVLLVVACDEGVMPQTREHVDICALLGARAGVVVLTKADTLEALGADWLPLVEADLDALTRGTFLEGAPRVQVSAKTGAGLPQLLRALEEVVLPLAERPADGPVFLPVDRSFTIKGFGAVVTGTLLSGQLAHDDAVALLPDHAGPLRIRGLQQHGAPVQCASSGERVAVNLQGVEASALRRGLALVRHGELAPAKVLDVELTLLPSVEGPLKRRTRQLLSLGTEHVEAVLQLVEVEALRPGETCFAQLRLGQAVAAIPGQRFILRGSTVVAGRGATLGGGRVLTLNPPRRRRGAQERLAAFAAAAAPQRLLWLLGEAGYQGLTERELFARAQVSAKELGRLLEQLTAQGSALLVDREGRRYLGGAVFSALQARLLARLEALHDAEREADGFSKQMLRQQLGVTQEKTFARLLLALTEGKRIEQANELLRLPGRRRTLDARGTDVTATLRALLEKGGLQPPLLAELALAVQQPPERAAQLLAALVQQGVVVKAADLYFDAAALAALQARLVAHLEAKQSITTQEFKELTGLTRKFLIPLAEYFDAAKVTLRVGEKRVLRRKS